MSKIDLSRATARPLASGKWEVTAPGVKRAVEIENAVNSFEAMREALQTIVEYAGDIDALDIQRVAEAALALAEGKGEARDFHTDEQNACLISAAPEGLELAKMVVADWVGRVGYMSVAEPNGGNEIVKLARTIIAKCEGEK